LLKTAKDRWRHRFAIADYQDRNVLKLLSVWELPKNLFLQAIWQASCRISKCIRQKKREGGFPGPEVSG
jgi:hypothetical protein